MRARPGQRWQPARPAFAQGLAEDRRRRDPDADHRNQHHRNLFGEGHLPYADRPDGGVLGIYVTVARQRSQILRYFLDVARGRWRDSPQVEIHEGERVVLTLLSRGGKRRCVIDGELLPLKRQTTIEIHKKVLKVLVPAQPNTGAG